VKGHDSAFAGAPSTGGTDYLVGDFETMLGEVGARVLLSDLDENDWHWFPWCDAHEDPVEDLTCPLCHGTGKIE
jgi:hypothetical protein